MFERLGTAAGLGVIGGDRGMTKLLRALVLASVMAVAGAVPVGTSASNHSVSANEYSVPGISAKDGSPLTLHAFEKHDSGSDPNELARSGRIILLLHGATTSGRVNYDVQVAGNNADGSFSLMDRLADNGWDAWTVDYQNYGRSDHHDCGLCVNTAAAARDIESVVDFILELRGVSRLDVMGWSWGGQTGGVFAQKSPQKVNRLILYAPIMDLQGPPPPTDQFRHNDRATLSGFFYQPGIIPEVVDAYVEAALEVDEFSPNGVLVDWRTDPRKTDPKKLTMPTMMIWGSEDDRAPLTQNGLDFFRALPAKDKKLVVVSKAGHGLFLEQRKEVWYREVFAFLEDGLHS
jgi:pimeloyl-ACP methyl ester carboxylesterase